MDSELQNILERILGLYRKYGIKSVTMDDAAAELGISKKTLYQYFSDKDDLVSKTIEYEASKRIREFDEIQDKNQDAIAELLEVSHCLNLIIQEYSPVIEHDLKKYYPAHYNRIQELRRVNMYESVIRNIRKGKEEGIFRSDLNEEIISKIYVSRIMCMHENPFFTTGELTSSRVFFEILFYHIRGIANDKGLQLLDQYLKQDTYKLNNNLSAAGMA